MTHQINVGVDGRADQALLLPPGAGGTRSRQVFHCEVTASAQHVTYPFDGVVQPAPQA